MRAPRSSLLLAASALLAVSGPAAGEEPKKTDVDLSVSSSFVEPKAPPKNRLMAILEGPIGTNVVMNVGGRVLKSENSYDSTWDTFVDNLNGPWEYDGNDFGTNQFLHPYQGTFYMTAGRTLGIGFWESSLYTGIGSFLWETAGEIHPPSVNDQITTTVGGALFGEVLYRLSSQIIESGGDGDPGIWRELGAFVASPLNGINRQFYGNRYRDRRVKPFGSSGELALAVSIGGKDDSTGENKDVNAGNVSLIANMVHGLPDDDGWRFRRPFDHFTVSSSLYLDNDTLTNRTGLNLLVHGLLLAADPYGKGVSSGLWGLWGVYDTISTGELRSSTSGLALGTVGQLAPSGKVRLQGTLLLGAGFGAAGTNANVEDKRDYHFGAQGFGTLSLRMLWANRVRVRASASEYVTGDELSPDQGGYEDLTYTRADVTYRVYGGHALGFDVVGARRKARYPDVPDTKQKFSQYALTYSYVSEPSMGSGRAMSW